MTTETIRRYAKRVGRVEELPVGLTLLAGAIAATVLAPMAWLVLRAASIGPDETLAMLASDTSITVLVNSLALLVGVTGGSILVGVPLAFITVRTDVPLRRLWTVAASLPLVIPSYIGAFAFVSAFGPRGELQSILAPLGIESLPSIYGFGGSVLVLTLFTYPYVFLTTRAALLSFDTTLVDAARTLNHSRWEAFRRVTVPQIKPAVAAGSLLVALYAISDFGTPSIMHFDTFTRLIYVQYNAWGRDFAALLSLQLVAVTVVILAVESRVSDGTGTNYTRGSVNRSSVVSLGRWTPLAVAFCVVVALFGLVVPLGVLGLWLVRSDPAAATAFPWEWRYAWNSVSVSALAAFVAVLAGLPVAYLAARRRSAAVTLIERATYVGYAVPGIVLALALVYFGTSYASALYQTLPMLIFAYVIRFLPQAVGVVRSSVLQVDPHLTEAARTLGHSSGETFRRVTLPLIAPGILAGGALVFLTTMKELPATLVLRPTAFDTFVTYIWQVQSAGYYGQAAIPALILVFVSGISLLVLVRMEDYNVK